MDKSIFTRRQAKFTQNKSCELKIDRKSESTFFLNITFIIQSLYTKYPTTTITIRRKTQHYRFRAS